MYYEWSTLHVRRCAPLYHISVSWMLCYECWCVVTDALHMRFKQVEEYLHERTCIFSPAKKIFYFLHPKFPKVIKKTNYML